MTGYRTANGYVKLIIKKKKKKEKMNMMCGGFNSGVFFLVVHINIRTVRTSVRFGSL